MSFIIRLQHLSRQALSSDVRQFFSGLAIPSGAVCIVGGDTGTAFIGFETDEDARLAMERNGRILCDKHVDLSLSSRKEMNQAMERARELSRVVQSMETVSKSECPASSPAEAVAHQSQHSATAKSVASSSFSSISTQGSNWSQNHTQSHTNNQQATSPLDNLLQPDNSWTAFLEQALKRIERAKDGPLDVQTAPPPIPLSLSGPPPSLTLSEPPAPKKVHIEQLPSESNADTPAFSYSVTSHDQANRNPRFRHSSPSYGRMGSLLSSGDAGFSHSNRPVQTADSRQHVSGQERHDPQIERPYNDSFGKAEVHITARTDFHPRSNLDGNAYNRSERNAQRNFDRFDARRESNEDISVKRHGPITQVLPEGKQPVGCERFGVRPNGGQAQKFDLSLGANSGNDFRNHPPPNISQPPPDRSSPPQSSASSMTPEMAETLRLQQMILAQQQYPAVPSFVDPEGLFVELSRLPSNLVDEKGLSQFLAPMVPAEIRMVHQNGVHMRTVVRCSLRGDATNLVHRDGEMGIKIRWSDRQNFESCPLSQTSILNNRAFDLGNGTMQPAIPTTSDDHNQTRRKRRRSFDERTPPAKVTKNPNREPLGMLRTSWVESGKTDEPPTGHVLMMNIPFKARDVNVNEFIKEAGVMEFKAIQLFEPIADRSDTWLIALKLQNDVNRLSVYRGTMNDRAVRLQIIQNEQANEFLKNGLPPRPQLINILKEAARLRGEHARAQNISSVESKQRNGPFVGGTLNNLRTPDSAPPRSGFFSGNSIFVKGFSRANKHRREDEDESFTNPANADAKPFPDQNIGDYSLGSDGSSGRTLVIAPPYGSCASECPPQVEVHRIGPPRLPELSHMGEHGSGPSHTRFNRNTGPPPPHRNPNSWYAPPQGPPVQPTGHSLPPNFRGANNSNHRATGPGRFRPMGGTRPQFGGQRPHFENRPRFY